MTRKFVLVAILALAVAAGACGGSGNGSPTQPTTPSISISPTSTSVAVGTPVTFTVSGAASAPAWSVSGGASLATSGMTATLCCTTAGTYTVTATVGSQQAQATATFTPAAPTWGTPPEGALGRQLAFAENSPGITGGPYPPAWVDKPVNVVIPPEVVAHRNGLDSAAPKVAALLGVPVTVSTAEAAGALNVPVVVTGNVIGLSRSMSYGPVGSATLSVINVGNTENPIGMMHELGHLIMFHCSGTGCGMMGQPMVGGDFSPQEKSIAAWLQAGAK